jgi:hypothetical protein
MERRGDASPNRRRENAEPAHRARSATVNMNADD